MLYGNRFLFHNFITSTNRYFLTKDQLGSTTGLIDGSGSLVQAYSYDVYGATYVQTGTGQYAAIKDYTGNLHGNERFFTGREYDREVDLYYYRARYYDANLGRFISRDPIGMADNINLYTYVGNNPVMFTDPMGLEKYIIMMGTSNKPSERSGRELVISYQVGVAMKQGVDPKNIIIVENIMTPEQFNCVTQPYVGNIKKAVYIEHGSPSNAGGINKNNVSELLPINVSKNDHASVLFIACKAGQGENSIAQDASNQLNATVTAATETVVVNEYSDFNSWYKPGNPTIYIGEPTVPKGTWLNFTPNS